MSRQHRSHAKPIPKLDPVWLMAALCSMVLLVAPWQLGTLDTLPNLWLALAVGGLLLLELLKDWRSSRPREKEWGEELIWLLVFCLFLAYSVARADSVHKVVSTTEAARVVACLMFGIIAGRNARRAECQMVIIGAVVLAAATIGRAAVIEQRTATDERWRTFVTFANSNLLAAYLAMSLPLVLGLAIAVHQRLAHADLRPALRALLFGLLAVAGSFIGAGLWTTGSRGGLLAGTVGVLTTVLLFCFFVSRSRAARGAGLALTVVAVLGLGVVIARISQRARLTPTSEDHSARFRQFTWRASWDMALDRPLAGFGAGTYQYAFPRFAIAGFTRHPHSNYLLWASELGLIGCAAIGIVLLWTLVHGVLALANAREPVRAPLACGLLGTLAAFLIHGLFDTAWQVSAVTLTLGLLFGISHLVSGLRFPTSKSPVDERPKRWQVVLVATLVLGLIALQVRRLCAEQSHLEAGECRRLGAVNSAIDAERNAVRLLPRSGDYHLRLAHLLRDRYFQQGNESDLTESLREYEVAAKWMTTSPGPPLMKGQLLIRLERFHEAQRAFERALSHEPHNSTALVKLGECLLQQQARDRAREVFGRVAKLQEGPWGRYPAIPYAVDLNVGRAYRHLAGLAVDNGDVSAAHRWHALATKWVERGIELDRFWRQLREAGDVQAPPREEWDAEQAQLDELKQRLNR